MPPAEIYAEINIRHPETIPKPSAWPLLECATFTSLSSQMRRDSYRNVNNDSLHMIQPVASPNPLDAFSAAWHACFDATALPTLTDLKDRGAPLDDPGFAMLGRSDSQQREKSKPAFRVLEIGPGHGQWSSDIQAGQLLDEFVHPAHLQSLTSLYQRLCDEQTLHRWRCTSMARNAAPVSYTRVLAPIADDVGDGRCLAGIWTWHLPRAKDAVAA